MRRAFTHIRHGVAALICLLLVLAPAELSGQARTIAVRSGEHDGFSRIVIPLPKEQAWRRRDGRDRVEIAFPGLRSRIDVSRVFRRIGRQRIVDVDALPGPPPAVRVTTAPDVSVRIFRLPDGRLVVDFGNVARDPGNVPERETEQDPVRAAEEPDGPAGPSPSQPVPARGDPAIPRAKTAIPLPPRPHPGRLPRLPVPVDAASPPRRLRMPPQMPDLRIETARRALLRELGRAMSEGLVSPIEPAIPAGWLPGRLQSGSGASLPGEGGAPGTDRRSVSAGLVDRLPGEGGRPALRQPGMRATTPLQRAGLDGKEKEAGEASVRECPELADVPKRLWPGGDGNSVGLSELSEIRKKLAGEFDRIEGPAAKRLLRFYARAGLAAELELVSGKIGLPRAESDMLMTVASILDGGEVPAAVRGRIGTRCLDGGGVWALAAAERFPSMARAEFPAVERAFAALPAPVRMRLGPVLGNRLIDAGFIPEAAALAILTTRSALPESPEFRFFQARLDVARGEVDRAVTALAGLARLRDPVAPLAAVELAAILSGSDTAPAANVVLDVSALAFMYRRAPIGKALRDAAYRLMAAAGKRERALRLLAHDAGLGLVASDTAALTAARILAGMGPEDIRSGQFAKMFFAFRETLGKGSIPADLRRELARLLIESGLPDPALRILGEVSADSPGESRVIAARALIESGDDTRALELLHGLADPRADRLRVLALRRRGERIAGSDDPEPAVRAADRSAPAGSAITLGEAKAMLETSRKLRETADGLLQAGEAGTEGDRLTVREDRSG